MEGKRGELLERYRVDKARFLSGNTRRDVSARVVPILLEWRPVGRPVVYQLVLGVHLMPSRHEERILEPQCIKKKKKKKTKHEGSNIGVGDRSLDQETIFF